jgi:hypothetical protein
MPRHIMLRLRKLNHQSEAKIMLDSFAVSPPTVIAQFEHQANI